MKTILFAICKQARAKEVDHNKSIRGVDSICGCVKMLWRGQVCVFLCVHVYIPVAVCIRRKACILFFWPTSPGECLGPLPVSLCAAEPVSIVGGLGWLPSPLAHGVGVADNQLVYPGEGLGKQHGPLEEAQVAPVLGQHKQHVGFFVWRREARWGKENWLCVVRSHLRVTYLWSHCLNFIIHLTHMDAKGQVT